MAVRAAFLADFNWLGLAAGQLLTRRMQRAVGLSSASAHIRLPLSGCKCVEGEQERERREEDSLTRRLPKTEHTHRNASHLKYISIPRPQRCCCCLDGSLDAEPASWLSQGTGRREGDAVERGCVRYLLLSFNLQFVCVCARSHKSCRNFSHCFVWISGDFPGLLFSLFSLPKVNNNCSNHAGGFIRVGSCLLSILLSICLPD